ncbi:MAG: TetR family transcriptional regulator [Nocardioidaceae bacterium]
MTAQPVRDPADPEEKPESARKAELVAKLLDYSAEHGLSSMSLRPLAAAVGSSPRVLLYLFGSKDELIREVLVRSRRNQQALAETWVNEASEPAERIGRLWTWLSDPAQAGIERLFFESYARSLHDVDGPWRDFGADSVADWVPVIEGFLVTGTRRRRSTRTRQLATFVLATMRGLLIDLLATGDLARADAGIRMLQDHVRMALA